MQHRETVLVKLAYIAAFLVSALGAFFATDGFAAWEKSKSELLTTLPIQLIVTSPPLYLISNLEGRVMWRLFQEDGFSSIYPVSLGIFIGYLIHFTY